MPNMKIELNRKEAILIANLLEFLREDTNNIKKYIISDSFMDDSFINKVYFKFRGISDAANYVKPKDNDIV